MIELTRLNKKKFILNSELIETIESTPDTVITLRNGKLCIVQETPQQIAEMVLKYRQSQFSGLLLGVLKNLPPNFVPYEGSPANRGDTDA